MGASIVGPGGRVNAYRRRASGGQLEGFGAVGAMPHGCQRSRGWAIRDEGRRWHPLRGIACKEDSGTGCGAQGGMRCRDQGFGHTSPPLAAWRTSAARASGLSPSGPQVGIPRQHRRFVGRPAAWPRRLVAARFPPVPQELYAKRTGRVVVNSAVDRPWSQYFCCIVTGNREFVRKPPVATKRALRAILKATDVCALEPDRAAQRIVDRGFTSRYDYALQTM